MVLLVVLHLVIGTSEVEYVLETQILKQNCLSSMQINILGTTTDFVTEKDIALYIIGIIDTAGVTGHVIEFFGNAIKKLSMESRMTLCNTAIEMGPKFGLIAPDEITFSSLHNRNFVPKKEK